MVEYVGSPPGIIMQPPVGCLCRWVHEWWSIDWGAVLVLHTENIDHRCPLHSWKIRLARPVEDD